MPTHAPSHRWRRWLATTIAILVVLVTWVLGVGVDIDLGWLRDDIDAALTAALGADVGIEGAVTLHTRLPPGLSVSEVSVTPVVPVRTAGLALTEIEARRLEVRVALLPLLRGVVALRDLEVDGVVARMVPAPASEVTQAPASEVEAAADPTPNAVGSLAAGRRASADVLSAVRHIGFTDVVVELGGRPVVDSTLLRVESLGGELHWDEPVLWTGRATLVAEPLDLRLRSDSLAALLERGGGWEIALELDGPGRQAGLSTVFQRPDADETGAGVFGALAGGLEELDVETFLRVDRLSRLSPLTGLALSDSGPLEVDSVLRLVPDRVSHWTLDTRLAGSRAQGELTIEQLDPLVVLAQLRSPAIELLDFGLDATDVMRVLAPTPATARQQPESPSDSPDRIPAPLWRLLRTAEARLTLEAERVTWNGERLGAGTLVASASEGLLLVAPLRIEIPGGAIELNGELTVGEAEAGARIRGEIDGFDWGVMLRQLVPDTDMGGRLWLGLDVSSKATRWEDLLPAGTGVLRVAVEPENLQSGVLDLWAIDLIGALASRYDDESVIQCVAARIRLEDGVARDEAILLETTHVRVVGRGQVDFRAGTADLAFRPRAKSRRLISLDPAVRVAGPLEEIEARLRTGDVLESLAVNAARVYFFPLPFLLETPAPADGRLACSEVFDASGG